MNVLNELQSGTSSNIYSVMKSLKQKKLILLCTVIIWQLLT